MEPGTLNQQPKLAIASDVGTTQPIISTDLVTVPEKTTATRIGSSPIAHDHTSGKVASINTLSEARHHLTPKPPSSQNAKFKEKAAELDANKSLSKSALKD